MLLFKGHRYTQGVPGILFKGTDSINRLSRSKPEEGHFKVFSL